MCRASRVRGRSTQSRISTTGSPTLLLLAILVGLLSLGCEKHDDWTPGPEETSSRFLDPEVEGALAAIEEARRESGAGPDAAARALVKARLPLLRLRDYYLPLLEARGRAHNALRWYHLGDSGRALDDLEAIESLLLGISDRGDQLLSRALDPSLETVVHAKAAMRAGRPEAPDLIERLGDRINLMLLKGGLVLQGSSLDQR